jgi:uncharacterized membrane protein required for colicin V production
MNVLILAVFVAIGIFALFGWKVGLVRRVVEFAGLIVSFLFATHFAAQGADWLSSETDMQARPALVVTWIAVFLAGLFLTRLLAWSMSRTIDFSILGFFDRLGGALLGTLIGAILMSAILVGVSMMPGGESVRASFQSRPLPRLVYNAAPAVYVLIQRAGIDKHRVIERLYDEVDRRLPQAGDQAGAGSSPANRE